MARRPLAFVALGATSIAACNAILGIEEVPLIGDDASELDARSTSDGTSGGNDGGVGVSIVGLDDPITLHGPGRQVVTVKRPFRVDVTPPSPVALNIAPKNVTGLDVTIVSSTDAGDYELSVSSRPEETRLGRSRFDVEVRGGFTVTKSVDVDLFDEGLHLDPSFGDAGVLELFGTLVDLTAGADGGLIVVRYGLLDAGGIESTFGAEEISPSGASSTLDVPVRGSLLFAKDRIYFIGDLFSMRCVTYPALAPCAGFGDGGVATTYGKGLLGLSPTGLLYYKPEPHWVRRLDDTGALDPSYSIMATGNTEWRYMPAHEVVFRRDLDGTRGVYFPDAGSDLTFFDAAPPGSVYEVSGATTPAAPAFVVIMAGASTLHLLDGIGELVPSFGNGGTVAFAGTTKLSSFAPLSAPFTLVTTSVLDRRLRVDALDQNGALLPAFEVAPAAMPGVTNGGYIVASGSSIYVVVNQPLRVVHFVK